MPNKNLKIRNNSEKIIEKYNQGINTYNIGKEFNCGETLIQRVLKENNALMTNSERKLFLISIGKIKGYNKREDIRRKFEEIIRMYNLGMSTKEIGIIFNCSGNSIQNILRENNSLMNRSIRRKFLFNINKIKNWSEGLKKETNERVKLAGENLSKAIQSKSKEEKDIKRKKMSALKQGVSIDEWKGFSNGEYDERWTPQFRNSIRKRDNQVCMNCGIHREKLRRALSVHHINSEKKMSIQENCVSLCNSCHSLTKTNREYWQKLFQEKLSKLYGYKYSEDGKIILELKNQVIN